MPKHILEAILHLHNYDLRAGTGAMKKDHVKGSINPSHLRIKLWKLFRPTRVVYSRLIKSGTNRPVAFFFDDERNASVLSDVCFFDDLMERRQCNFKLSLMRGTIPRARAPVPSSSAFQCAKWSPALLSHPPALSLSLSAWENQSSSVTPCLGQWETTGRNERERERESESKSEREQKGMKEPSAFIRILWNLDCMGSFVYVENSWNF